MRYKNNKEFIKRCIKIHDNKYDYSLTIYEKWNKKIKIICVDHGEFEKIPAKHINGEGCPQCSKIKGGKKRRLGLEKFIKESIKKHGNKYDYNLVKYTNNKTKVNIKCSDHGIFSQSPDNHLSGNGCPRCSNNYKKSKKELLNIFNKKHGNLYKYIFPKQFNIKEKITIICSEHGEFEQIIENHINGQKCPKCSLIKRSQSRSLNNEKFISKSNSVHHNKYDYSKSEYGENNLEKVTIICPEHGEFKQTPRGHMWGFGCPKCSSSKGESKIIKILEKNNIKYVHQHTFENCKYRSKLKFDFYLPELNTCIEYDGIQHFKPIDHFGGYQGFKETKKRDYIKNEYCETNDINLIRIPYFQNNIENFLLYIGINN